MANEEKIKRVRLSDHEDAVKFLRSCAKYLITRQDESAFASVEDLETRQLGAIIEQRVGNAVGAFMQLNGVSEEIEIASRMLRRYPWHGTGISKSSHLEMTWFLIQNLCYHFKEKAKLYFNQQKSAAAILGLPAPNWLGEELKYIDRMMGEAIKDRGNTVHGWNVRENSIYTYSLIELLEEVGEGGHEWDLKGHYSGAKFYLRMKANRFKDSSHQSVMRCLQCHEPKPDILVQRFNEVAEAVLEKNQTLIRKEVSR